MMIQTLLSHFYRPDETPESAEILMADWLVALRDKPLQAVATARARWIAERTRRPTIAEFLEWVNGASAEHITYRPREGRTLLPVPTEQDGSLTLPSRMSEPDLWSWHARIRATRKFMGLRNAAPVDLEGRYLDRDLDRQAEAEYLAKHPDALAKPRVQTALEREAAEARQAFATAHRFKDFTAVMQVGIARVGR